MNVIDDNLRTMPSSIFPHTYKIMIIGKSGVGKTSLLWRFLYNEFKDLRGTIIDKETKTCTVRGKDVDLELWDTARLETYCTLSPQYLRDANAVIIAYDITDTSSYVEVKENWIRMVYSHFGEDADQHVPIILVGNKSDLIDKYDDMQVRVRVKDVQEDIKNTHMLGPFECSAKTGRNVDTIFQKAATEIVQRDMEGSTQYRMKTRVRSIDRPCSRC